MDGNYHLSVTDADAMDAIDSEPAVTLDNIQLAPTTNINPSVNPSLLPGATSLPTGTLLGSSYNDSINENSVYVYSLHCGGPSTEGIIYQ